MPPMLQIVVGVVIMVITIAIHQSAVSLSLQVLKRRIANMTVRRNFMSKIFLVISAILALSLAVFMEAGIWAVLFVQAKIVDQFWSALYFAIVTLTTLGYGDIVPSDDGRLLAAICAVTGLFVMGLSTGFVIEILRRMEAE